MAKKKQTKQQKDKDKQTDATVTPNVSEFVGKKLKDIRREEGVTILDFSNGYSVKLSGYINFKIEESK